MRRTWMLIKQQLMIAEKITKTVTLLFRSGVAYTENKQ